MARSNGNDEYLAMTRRIIRGAGKRVADADIASLVELVELHEVLREATDHAVIGLLAEGYSYGDIGRVLGMTRQAAHQRYAKAVRRSLGMKATLAAKVVAA